MLPVCPCALSKQGTGTCKVKLLAKVRRCRTFSRYPTESICSFVRERVSGVDAKRTMWGGDVTVSAGEMWSTQTQTCTFLGKHLSQLHKALYTEAELHAQQHRHNGAIYRSEHRSWECDIYRINPNLRWKFWLLQKKKKKKLRIKIKNLRAFSAISNRSDFRINYIIQHFMISNNQHPTPKIQLLWTLKKIQAHAIKLHVFIRLFVSLGHVLEDSSKIIFK